MTLANWLTVMRIILIPFFIATLMYDHLLIALILFVSAAITDVLDGYIARRTTCTTIGRVLDPTADKLLLVSTYIILPIIGIIPSWVTVIVVSRDVIIALGYLIIYLTWGSAAVDVSRLGKLSTFIQSFGAGFFLLATLLPVLAPWKLLMMVLVAGFTTASGVTYIIQGIHRASLLSLEKGKQ